MSNSETLGPPEPARGGDESRILQPNSSHCFACGVDNPFGLQLRFYSIGSGRVEAKTIVPRRYEGYPGVVHGGIVATMLDEIVGRLAMTEDPDHFLVTARLEVRYRTPIPIEEQIMLKGELQERRGRRHVGYARLVLEDGRVGAEAEAVLMDHPDTPSDSELLRSLGWGVYPEAE
jgi:acyl-coenzyme A thioesterase PaaI-like protein